MLNLIQELIISFIEILNEKVNIFILTLQIIFNYGMCNRPF